MECRDCGNRLDPESTFCEACGAPVDPASRPVTPGRKWAARLLRFLGMTVISASALFTWVAWDAFSRSDRPVFVGLAFVVLVMGGGINYAGRRLNPQAGRVTVWGTLGLFGGGAVFLIVMILLAALFLGAVVGAWESFWS